MKKKELFKKISFAMAVIASTGMLCACGSNGASMSMDRKSADSEPAAYYTDDVTYAGAGDYYDEVENYDGDFGTTADTAPINENQANASVAKNRKLIRTVDMDIETTGFDDTIRSIKEKINEVGGYIESENSFNGSIYNGTRNNKYATITVRVPDDKLDVFVNNVSGVGNVTQKNTSTRDVTLSYVDTESKKEMYLAEQESLLALLEKAETIEDITYLTQRLTEVRYNIESMESTLRVYDDLVDYATVNLSVNEVKVLTPTVVVEKTPAQELKEGFETSVKDVLVDTRSFFINLLINSPYIIRGLICLAIPAVIIFVIIRIIIASKRKKAKKGAEYLESIKKEEAVKKEKAEPENKENTENK
ncbi:MAG: DUF4349 domain-containing protein [Lachnospiraceae bacterium]|nr:DUF4349 domain-containing protein [Lachnospiraceae bacterium]